MDIDRSEVAPENILPIQLVDTQFRGARIQPEKRLQLAVLTEALMTHTQSTTAVGSRGQSARAEVDEWFTSDVPAGPFSFIAICDSLGLEPTYVRQGLRALRSDVAAPGRRTLLLRRDRQSRHQVVGPRVRRVA